MRPRRSANALPVKARGTFLRRVVAELRGCGDFSDDDVEQVVRGALDQSVGTVSLRTRWGQQV
jgi:hypothetical protein